MASFVREQYGGLERFLFAQTSFRKLHMNKVVHRYDVARASTDISNQFTTPVETATRTLRFPS